MTKSAWHLGTSCIGAALPIGMTTGAAWVHT